MNYIWGALCFLVVSVTYASQHEAQALCREQRASNCRAQCEKAMRANCHNFCNEIANNQCRQAGE